MSEDCDSSCGCAAHQHGAPTPIDRGDQGVPAAHGSASRLSLELVVETDGPLAAIFPGTNESAFQEAVLGAAGVVANGSELMPDGLTSVTIMLSSDDTVAELNATYRGKNKATNVLSFPSPGNFPVGPDGVRHLGDIVFAAETIAAEAVELDRPILDHVRHLTVHGLLHLLGLDHENDEEAEHMEQLETRMLSAIGVADPYAGGEPTAS